MWGMLWDWEQILFGKIFTQDGLAAKLRFAPKKSMTKQNLYCLFYDPKIISKEI
jgi:hypothetical protein